MFGKRFELFKLFGFAIRIDASWFLLAVLITWSLATGVFPALVSGLPPATYWLMGASGALGLFASVVLHELSHSLVARRQGVEMKGITLFIFGGVAEMSGEPPRPKAELIIAVAGPIASLAIGAASFGLGRLGRQALDWPAPVVAVFSYLALINVVLAVFNMVPAFPLDGGRVLRAILWQAKGSLRWATRVTSAIGAGFGTLLIVLGLVRTVTGDVFGGIWSFLIGLFLRGAAHMSYQQLLLRQTLSGEPVRRFMKAEPVTVPRSISVRELVEDYVYRHHFKLFPVVEGERLVGCVTTREIKQLPREEWERQSVGSIAQPCGEANSVAPEEDAMKALARMSGQGASRLMVVEGGRLVGVLALKDLLAFFSDKLELEDVAPSPSR